MIGLWKRPVTSFLLAFFVCSAPVSPASAQITEGHTAFDNLQRTQERIPGILVANGIARTQQRIILPFGGLENTAANITATEPPQSRTDVFIGTLVDALFLAIADQLSQMLTNFISSLFGGELSFPDLSAGDPGGSGDSTTADDTTADDGSSTSDDSGGGRDGVRKVLGASSQLRH